jgi:hypothetical protein
VAVGVDRPGVLDFVKHLLDLRHFPTCLDSI